MVSHPAGAALPLVMGVVNVTPDSFSDGGLYADPASAIAHGRALLADGADILDVGGESTRPGATRPLVEEELGRVVPVVTALAADGATVSVDTMRHEVAAAALAAGARIVNDVSGGLADPEILRVVADSDATYVAMHWRAHADHMTDFATYDEPGRRGRRRPRRAGGAGRGGAGGRDRRRTGWSSTPGSASPSAASTTGSCWSTSGRSRSSGYPLLVGASRKSFLGTLLADADGTPRPVDGRDDATTALSVVLAQVGCVGAPGARRTLHPRRPASAGRTRDRSGGGAA